MAPLSGRLPKSFIHELLSRVDIVPLISEFVPIKKRGNNYTACCPFHKEKTPSFSVNHAKQFFHCFGCGVHGDAIEFLMRQNGLSFLDAVELLAQRVGLEIPQTKVTSQDLGLQPQKDALAFALGFFTQQWRTEGAKVAIEYLKSRGLDGKIAKVFALGFAPAKWDGLKTAVPTDLQTPALEAGVLMQSEKGRVYDRFRNRVVFPIRDPKGSVVGFGARTMGDDKPKYLNSPESPVFRKKELLYGIYEARQAVRNWQMAYVVEGYMDVIALSQAGIMGAVASMGTALTTAQLQLLFRYVQDIIFCFDGDNAGREAAWKALLNALPLMADGRRVRFMFLPYKMDPDSFIRQNGKEQFIALSRQSVPLSEFLYGELVKKYPLDSMDGCARFAKEAKPLLQQLPKGVFSNLMHEQLQILIGARRKILPSAKFKPNMPTKPAPPKLTSPIYLIAALLMRCSKYATKISQTLKDGLDLPGLALLHTLLGALKHNPAATEDELLQILQERGFALKALYESKQRIALLPDDALDAELKGALQRLGELFEEQELDNLLLKAKENTLNEQERQLLMRFLAE